MTPCADVGSTVEHVHFVAVAVLGGVRRVLGDRRRWWSARRARWPKGWLRTARTRSTWPHRNHESDLALVVAGCKTRTAHPGGPAAEQSLVRGRTLSVTERRRTRRPQGFWKAPPGRMQQNLSSYYFDN